MRNGPKGTPKAGRAVAVVDLVIHAVVLVVDRLDLVLEVGHHLWNVVVDDRLVPDLPRLLVIDVHDNIQTVVP